MTSSTAILVIDIQRGAFDGVRLAPIDEPDRLIENAVKLVNAARQNRVGVIFIQHCEGAGELFEEGSAQWELHPSLVPLAAEAIIHKRNSSAFEQTALGESLSRIGVRTLVLCGLQSEYCVQSTARAALAEGFEVMIARDGHSTWPTETESAREISERINRELEASGAKLMTTAAIERLFAPVS